MSGSSSSSSAGIGFAGLLTVLFVALKLADVISWSWWWVLAPIWIEGAVIAAMLLGVFLLWTGVTIYEVLDVRARGGS